MKFLHSRTGAILALAYMGLYLLSGIYAVFFLLFRPPTAEFNPPSLAVLPWSFVIIPITHSWGITDWYQEHAGSPIAYGAVMTLVLLPGALLNAIILYLIGKVADRQRGT